MPHIGRVETCPRPDWTQQAAKLGYTYYRNDDGTYAWREDVRYEITRSALRLVSEAAETLHALCLDLIADVMRRPSGLDDFHIPRIAQDVVRQSWHRGDPFLLGRFDLAWNGSRLKLIEYNADTPATLPESTAMQDRWHRQCGGPHGHAPLKASAIVSRLKSLRRAGHIGRVLHIVPYPDNLEDTVHARFYEHWARKAGLEAIHCDLKDLDITTGGELLHRGVIIRSMIRMYPWELMFRDSGVRHLDGCGCQFLNPPWTALLSNKALLPALWRRFPGHPLLLEAAFSPEELSIGPKGCFVEKPIHARGGENIRILNAYGALCAESGTYGHYPKIYQAYADHRISGVHASIGAWIVGKRFSGLTIRESHDAIIRHNSSIVPHVILRRGGLAGFLGG